MKLYTAFTTFLWLLVLLALILATAGCVGLPTVEPTMTPDVISTPTAKMTDTPLAINLVTVTGNVWKRDANDNTQGWLAAGEIVHAICDGEWCVLSDGLRFWRGCSDNNPDGLACRQR